MYWVKYHLNHLRNWRKSVESISRALEDLGVSGEVYIIGGAAEDRFTVLSDIDVLICVSSCKEELAQLRRQVLAKAMDKYGLPWDYPIELHVHAKEECEKILKRTRKVLRWKSF